jgi:hypothetical protein
MLHILLVTTLLTIPAVAQEHQHAAPGEELGTVHFDNSCGAPAQPSFTRAVTLLHSFEFATAIQAFDQALASDPACPMAAWGIALSRWGNPFVVGIRPASQLKLGLAAIERANTIGAKTERERAYISAARQLYADAESKAQPARIVAYRDAMASLASSFPKDTEASIFYALSLTAAEAPNDKTYAGRLKAGAILEGLLPAQPDHPGLAHYIIHSYDVPALAPRAIAAARRYASIAPSAPHALHMPSHTFTRLGFWQDSIESNTRAGAAARRDGATGEELHTMDYRIYAYLQTAQDAAARRLVESLPEVRARFDPNAIGSAAPGSAGVFALAAIPARYALERRAWAEAAALEPDPPTSYPYAEAMIHFARALGAARTGNLGGAASAVSALKQIADRLREASEPFWAEQVEIQRRGAGAFLALADGRQDDALAEMRAAADAEDKTEKSAVTPGPLAPARELLGEMLLQIKEPARALEAFEAVIVKEPNRFRALLGASHAAHLAGNAALARKYATQLLKISERADSPGRLELVDARALAGRGLIRPLRND